MNRSLAVVICISAFLAFATNGSIEAQDCERAIEGNSQSPCKQLDYLDGFDPPSFAIERFMDSQEKYYCQGVLQWHSEKPLDRHESLKIAFSDSRTLSKTDFRHPSYHGSFGFSWPTTVDSRLVQIDANFVKILATEKVYLEDPVREVAHIEGYYPSHLWLYFQFTADMGEYVLVSEVIDSPIEVADYQPLMNQCLSGITRQLQHDLAVEEARQQAAEDQVRAETAADEAQNQAELAAIELASAEAALQAAEDLNVALLQETILAIKREDAIRAAWQQVMLVRLARLGRTNENLERSCQSVG